MSIDPGLRSFRVCLTNWMSLNLQLADSIIPEVSDSEWKITSVRSEGTHWRTLSPTCGIGGGEGGASGKVGYAAFLCAFAMVETA
jgi:hypothetical protein